MSGDVIQVCDDGSAAVVYVPPPVFLEDVPHDRGLSARHLSKTNEHFSPAYIVEAARATLGVIDFDPFSCAAANATIKANVYGGLDNGIDGFATTWFGRVFVNPPGGKTENQSNQKRAWFKLASEYAAGRVTAAVFLCFSVELLQTTQSKTPEGLALPLDMPICYPRKRVAYTREDGTVGGSPPHSSCIIYLPPKAGAQGWNYGSSDLTRFSDSFAPIGKVVIPW
jgi:hypothetical protein